MTNLNIHSSLQKHLIEIEDYYLNMVPIYIRQNPRITIYEKPVKTFHESPTSK